MLSTSRAQAAASTRGLASDGSSEVLLQADLLLAELLLAELLLALLPPHGAGG